MADNSIQSDDYAIQDGVLLHKGRLLLDPTSSLVPVVLRECHATPIAGHGGIQKPLLVCLHLLYGMVSRKMCKSLSKNVLCVKK